MAHPAAYYYFDQEPEKMGSVNRSWKLQEFVAHKANVNCLAMGHKSNQVLATGGDDKKVNLWAIGRHSCLMSLNGHTTPVECVCFGTSEDLVCAGSQTGALKIWDLEAAKLFRNFSGHKGAIKCMDFHPYADLLTTGSCDSEIKMWDTRQKGCVMTYSSHRLAVNSLQFSPDGQWIASACEDGIVKVWELRVAKVLKEFHEHNAPVTCVQFHPHEFLLASCGADRTVNFWDMEKFQLVSKYEKESVSIRHMMFSDNGNALLGASTDGLHVVGWEPARLLDSVPSHWGHIHDITVAQQQLIAGSFHSTYVVLSVVDLSKVHPFGGPPPPLSPLPSESSPFQKGQSVRKSFSKERPPKVVHKARTLDKSVEETSGGEAEDEPADIPNYSDYREIFKPNRALNRTPPPSTSICTSDYEDTRQDSIDENVPKTARSTTSLRDLSLTSRRPASPPRPRSPSNALHSLSPPHSPTRLAHSPPRSPPGRASPPPTPRRPENSRIPTSTKETKEQPRSHSPYEKGRPETLPRTEAVTVNRAVRDITVLPQPGLNRHNSYKESRNNKYIASSLRTSNSEINLGVPSLGPRSLSFTRVNTETRSKSSTEQSVGGRGARPPEQEPEFVPLATDRPVGLDLDEFLPKGMIGVGCGRRGVAGEPSEQEVLGVLMRGHESMMAVLTNRQRSLQIFHSVRRNKNLKAALESIISLDDNAVLVDILSVMAHKPSLWNLDICLLLLPKISELLQSKYESYMQCGVGALRLIMRNFSSVVKLNVEAPVRALGVDIPREERYAKCMRIHAALLDIRAFLLKRQTLQGRLGAAFRDLHALMEQGL